MSKDPLIGGILAGFNSAFYNGWERSKRYMRVRTLQEFQAAGFVWDPLGKFLFRMDVPYIITVEMLAHAGTVIDWNDYVDSQMNSRRFVGLPQYWCIEMFIDWDPSHTPVMVCQHEYVNVSFNGMTMACKHCGASEP